MRYRARLVARKHPTADDLLSGAVSPTASALLRCIHEVNPTARGLARRDEDRRYALKARLQSLLVRLYEDDLDVTLDRRDPRLVTIRHRHLDEDACHAILDALDDDARSIVQQLIDVGPADEPGAPRSEHPESSHGEAPADPVDAAERAIAEYDYESARTLLERACAARPDDVRAAAMFLELLVDTLVDDEAALARSWSKEARKDDRVRARLTLARARLAVARGDLDEAARRLPEIEPGIVDELVDAVRADLQRRRAAQKQDQEATLLEGVSVEHDPDAALHAAEQVLVRFPESVEARRLARAASNALVDRDVAALRVRAEAALAEGAHDRALAAWLEAAARATERHDPNPEHRDLADRAREAERALARVARDAEIERTIATLSSEKSVDALVKYLSLDDAARAVVRARVGFATLDRLEVVASTHRGAARALAEATLALDDALRIAETDPERAAVLLSSHRPYVGGLPEADAVFAARDAAERARRDAHRAAVEAQRAEQARIAEQAQIAERAEREARMARDFHVIHDRSPAPLTTLRPLEEYTLSDDVVYLAAGVGDDARPHVLHVETHDHWLFVAVVDVERRAIVRRVRVRTPVPTKRLSAAWDGHTLVVAGDLVLTLRIGVDDDPETTDASKVVEASIDATALFGLGERVRLDAMLVASDLHHVWVHVREDRNRERLSVLDLAVGRVTRELRGRHVQAMSGPRPQVSCVVERGLAVHDSRGVQQLRVDGVGFTEATPLPSGRGLALVRADHVEEPPLDLFVFFEGDAGRAPRTEHVMRVEGSSTTRVRSLATACDLVVLTFVDDDLEGHVVVLREQEGALVQVARASAPADAPIVVDRSGSRAFAWWRTPEGPTLVDLTSLSFPPCTPPLPRSIVPSLDARHPGSKLDARPFDEAHAALLQCDVSRARDALDRVEARTGPERAHVEHLRALAALLDDDVDAAEAALARVPDDAGYTCGFAIEGIKDVIAATKRSPDAHPALVATIDALRLADDAFARQDFDAALSALHGLDTAAASDLQALARSVAAHLGREDPEHAPSFEAHRAAAALRAGLDVRDPRSLPLGRATWPLAKIEEVAERAAGWLRLTR